MKSVISEVKQRYYGMTWKVKDFSWYLQQLSRISFPKGYFLSNNIKFPSMIIYDKGNPKLILKQSGNKILKLDKRDISEDYAWKILQVPEKINGKKQGIIKSANSYEMIQYENLLSRSQIPVNEQLFSEIFASQSFEKLKEIKYIQSNLKPILGKLDIIRIHYLSGKYPGQIDFIKQNIMKKQVILQKNVVLANKLCKKLCQVIHEVLGCEITEMIAEFYDTEHGLWLNDCWHILISNSIGVLQNNYSKEVVEEIVSPKAVLTRSLLYRLQNHEEEVKQDTTRDDHIKSLASIMEKKIKVIKKITGVADLFTPEAISSISNEAFTKLHPKSKYTLSMILTPNAESLPKLPLITASPRGTQSPLSKKCATYRDFRDALQQKFIKKM